MRVSEKILVRYGEIFLKSEKVFGSFEKKLIKNIKSALEREKINYRISKERGRIFVDAGSLALGPLAKVLGVVSYSPVFHLKTSRLSEIKEFCRKKFRNFVKKGTTFAVRARRTGNHDFSSREAESAVGSVIRGRVDLQNPDKSIFLEIRENDTYIFSRIYPGPGGMPSGTAGKVLSLLSGGIDSPVSSFLMMKRGCEVVFLHFHSFPLVSRKSIDKCKEIVKKLNEYQIKSELILVPFHKIQARFKTKAMARFLILLYRRSMLRIAVKIAAKKSAQALVTGESLAQVSSQTLPNLAAINAAAGNFPVFRPLIGFDKEEIIILAKKIGTFELSILPQEDCCTLFTPKNPATKSEEKILEKFESGLKRLEEEAVRKIEEIFI